MPQFDITQGWAVGQGADLEMTTPARPAGFVSDWLVPALQALTTGALVAGLIVFLLDELAPGWEGNTWKVWLAFALAFLLAAPGARAVEVLTVHDLISHCHRLEAEPEGPDAQYCIRYIQGFIDGAVATDVRVMLNVEADPDNRESFTQRAMRTRTPSRADQIRAARFAGI